MNYAIIAISLHVFGLALNISLTKIQYSEGKYKHACAHSFLCGLFCCLLIFSLSKYI